VRDLNSHAIPRPLVSRFDWGRRKGVRGDWGARENRGDVRPRGEEYNTTFFSPKAKKPLRQNDINSVGEQSAKVKGRGLRQRLFGAGIEGTTSPRLGRRRGIGPIGWKILLVCWAAWLLGWGVKCGELRCRGVEPRGITHSGVSLDGRMGIVNFSTGKRTHGASTLGSRP
jgi:hypothetical protein